MKTTVELEDELLRRAKKAAIDRGCTLRDLMTVALRRELADHEEKAEQRRGGIRWVSARGPWPKGLDVSSRDAMWAWLEGKPRRMSTAK
ncbi:MAG: hypothetical protein ACRD2D_04970 [Terriglobales bacterium]